MYADPVKVINDNVKLDRQQLLVKNERYGLSKVRNVFVIGAGKACVKMAYGLERILEDRITEGYVNVLRGTGDPCKTRRIRLNEASHPLPDEAGTSGTLRMIELIREAKRGDVVICLISGGGSALMPLPKEGVSLDEKIMITKELLRAGANINELNAVRKHLSGVKGGWLAKSVGGAPDYQLDTLGCRG